jgi:hydroxylaminobenzene mutase
MKTEYAQRMMFHGIVVFMFGLLTGFFLYSGAMVNPQIGVITHLEGVLNGLFLVTLGVIWQRMSLTDRQQWRLMVLALACVYINYFQALWGAVMGRSRATTLFPADRVPFPLEKTVLDVVLLSMSVGFIVVCLMTLWGLHRGMAAQRGAAPARPATV